MIDDLSYEHKKDEASFICENEHAFCILNFEPLNEGHVMVLPKRFVREVEELTAEEAKSFLDLCGLMRKTLDSMHDEKAILFQNGIRWRTQPRLHVHILPFDAGIRHLYPVLPSLDLDMGVRQSVEESELAQIRDAIRQRVEAIRDA